MDAIVVPVGGGGLIAGIALAVKTLQPNVKIIGVEPELCPSFAKALASKRPVATDIPLSTLADGLAVATVGPHAFATAQYLVDEVVQVSEKDISVAILRLMEDEKTVQEGAGVTALAACLANALPQLRNKKVVVPLCGGNIDTTTLGRVIERALTIEGRLISFSVVRSWLKRVPTLRT